jgi:hypothetical protein
MLDNVEISRDEIRDREKYVLCLAASAFRGWPLYTIFLAPYSRPHCVASKRPMPSSPSPDRIDIYRGRAGDNVQYLSCARGLYMPRNTVCSRRACPTIRASGD